MDEEKNLNSGLLTSSASFRELYYGAVAGAVPFQWESRPGTSKNDRAAASSSAVPPLTPPPSYYGAALGKRETRAKYPSRSGRLVHAVVMLISRRFRRPASSSSVSSNSRSSSFSSFSFSFSSCKWEKELDNSMN